MAENESLKDKVFSIYRTNGIVAASRLIGKLFPLRRQEALLIAKLRGLVNMWEDYFFRDAMAEEMEKEIRKYLKGTRHE